MSDGEETGPIRGLGAARDAVADFVRGRRVALATGGRSWTACGAEAAFADALSSAAAVRRVAHAGDLLSLAELDGVHASLADFDPDYFLAVGGGAAIDSTKVLALAAGAGRAPSELASGVPADPAPPPVFAVPTTAGTGAEATHFAVAYAGRTKKSIGHPSVRPAFVALVPDFTTSLSSYQTACTGFDAISQSIESLWARGATDESRAFARRAIGLCEAFDRVLAEPGDVAARAAMQEGAYWSGRAIDVSKTTAAHALSYFLTANYGVPHGHAVAMVFPYVARWNLARLADPGLAGLCERFDPRRIAELPALPAFCAARGIGFRALCADLIASADPARGSNNPAPLPASPDELFADAD